MSHYTLLIPPFRFGWALLRSISSLFPLSLSFVSYFLSRFGLFAFLFLFVFVATAFTLLPARFDFGFCISGPGQVRSGQVQVWSGLDREGKHKKAWDCIDSDTPRFLILSFLDTPPFSLLFQTKAYLWSGLGLLFFSASGYTGRTLASGFVHTYQGCFVFGFSGFGYTMDGTGYRHGGAQRHRNSSCIESSSSSSHLCILGSVMGWGWLGWNTTGSGHGRMLVFFFWVWVWVWV